MTASFEELVLKCDEASRPHIREAIRCYESGVYRASIVAAYTALCFDLIRKLRELSESGDKEARRQVSDLEKNQKSQRQNDPLATKKLLEFERDLISLFRDKFEFFGIHEYEALSRLVHDRNQCAHPTFLNEGEPYNPPAELARLHLRNVIDYALSQPPSVGKSALVTLRSIVTSNYFSTKSDRAKERLAAAGLKNPRQNLVPHFVDELCFGYATKGDSYYRLPEAITALEATIELQRALAFPRALKDINKIFVDATPGAADAASEISVMIPEIGEQLDSAARTVLRSWVERYTDADKAGMLNEALKIDWLKDTAAQAVSSLNADDIEQMDISMASAEIVSQTAKLYAKAGSWSQANKIAEDFILPLASRFSEDDVHLFIKAAQDGTADIRGSRKFPDVLEALSSEENPLHKQHRKTISDFKLAT